MCLLCSRLNAQSKGEATLTVETWKETVVLEQARVTQYDAFLASRTPAQVPQQVAQPASATPVQATAPVLGRGLHP